MQRLGQHFLKNKSAIKQIASSLELQSHDVIIEIGPGHGELTGELLEMAGGAAEIKIIVIEKDKNLAEQLRQTFASHKTLEVIEGDALKIIPQIVKAQKLEAHGWKLVGNIPYYITGYLLRIVGGLGERPSRSIITMQKEVAERIAAVPPKMNKLAASVQFWAQPHILGFLGKHDFSPPPQVDSAVLDLEASPKNEKIAVKKYYAVVNVLFAQPRKTILNNLAAKKDGATKEKIAEDLKKMGIDPEDRPQNLSIEKIIGITELF